MKLHTLERTQLIPRPRDEVFAFFADAANLERITPAFLRFRIVSPLPVRIEKGTLIDYQLSLFGVPFGWRTRIDLFRPDRCFVDTQLKGPYRAWHHMHEFDEVDGGTLMMDRVDYALPFGPLGDLARTLLVERTLERIFDHRAQAIGQIFASPAASDGATLRSAAGQWSA